MNMQGKASRERDIKGVEIQLGERYLSKEECVIDLPEPLLPSEKVREYRAIPRLAIVEIAGRDSVAAAIKNAKEKDITDLIPTYAYTGTEHGPWHSVDEAVRRLSRQLPHIRVHDLLVMGSSRFWQALNGRFISELIARYGFYTPCIGCHVYLHGVRIPLSLTLGKVPIISGERERHNGTVKINQIAAALDKYQGLAEEFGTTLVLPLRHIEDGRHIEKILGTPWQEGAEQLGCVLSGNYGLLDGQSNITGEGIQQYLDEFAYPLAKRVIRAYADGRVPDHVKIARTVLEGL
jgi:hypothetical protein